MFYKIDPTRRQMAFDLGADGFRVGDRLWVALQGDFQPNPLKGDTFQNHSFQIGSDDFYASPPARVTARDTTLVALNHDRPLTDNSDPDDDYGVRVKLLAFTAGDDFFDFRGRTALPEVQGSIYKAGAGNDTVVLPNAPVAGFDSGRVFKAGAGDDVVRAGALASKVDLGKGVDTFTLKAAEINWSNKENRDKDATLVVRSGDTRHNVSNAEILNDRGDRDPLVKWYFRVDRERDGDCTVTFFENGARVARAEGVYDATKAIAGGKYQAYFYRPDGRGSEQIELMDVNGFSDVSIRKGGGGNPRQDFVTSAAFIDAVFDQVADAYGLAGGAIPWRKGAAIPVVPITVELAGSTARAAAPLRAFDVPDDDFLL